jgi:uncharacterized membrane protein
MSGLNSSSMRLRVSLYGAASIAIGIINIVWGNFEAAHQPIQAFGDDIPGQKIFAYIVACCLIAGGVTILWYRTSRAGPAALAIVYLLFAVFWLPRFYTAVHALGFRIPVLIGVSSGVAQQVILVAAAAIVYASVVTRDPAWLRRACLAVRWMFGLSSINFGLAHFTGVESVSAMVPKWMPFGGDFWAVLTGIAFVLAGLAILAAILDVLAARLLTLMLFMFSALVLVPRLLASPHDHEVWGGNAYNLAAVGAVLIFADSIAITDVRRPDEANRNPT